MAFFDWLLLFLAIFAAAAVGTMLVLGSILWLTSRPRALRAEEEERRWLEHLRGTTFVLRGDQLPHVASLLTRRRALDQAEVHELRRLHFQGRTDRPLVVSRAGMLEAAAPDDPSN